MISFMEYLLEYRKPSKLKTSAQDADYIRNVLGYHDKICITQAIEITRKRYLTALERNNVELEDKESTTLEELMNMCKERNIVPAKRAVDWHNHEKDICAGINKLFTSKFFTVKGQDIDKDKFKAELAGGGKQSDIRVFHELSNKDDREFFVECKLNFQSAEYFKFRLTATGNKLIYDHKIFLSGDVKNDKEETAKIQELFKKIDLSKFLTDLIQSKELIEHWKQFTANIADIREFIVHSPEFKAFAADNLAKLSPGRFPQEFQNLTNVFDSYCQYYIDKYNQIIDKIFGMLRSDFRQRKEQYKISKRDNPKSIKDGIVFRTVDMLIADVKAHEEVLGHRITIYPARFKTLTQSIKKIEAKFTALLASEGIKPEQFDSIDKLADKNKLMCFFKMFVSSTGKKRKGQALFVGDQDVELGVMQLCPAVQLDTPVLAQMITDYYVTKDNCAYIQIADTILQFDEDRNPLKLPDLPIFKEAVTRFNIAIAVDDNLRNLHLKLFAVEFNDKALSGKQILSFKPSDHNFVSKKLKGIEV